MGYIKMVSLPGSLNTSQGPQATGGAALITPLLTKGDTSAILRAWQTGQIFTADVLTPGQNGVTLLRINGALISTQAALPLTPGQTLQVKVVATGAQPTLQIVTPEPETPPAPVTADTLNQSLRATLPKQAPLSPLLANLVWLARADGGGLPPAVVETARQLFGSLSTPRDISTGAGLSASLQRSGLFLEARLSQADTAALATDFKAGLLRLRETLLTTEAASTPGKQTQPASPSVAAPSLTPAQNAAAIEARAPAQAHAALFSDPATSAPPPLRGAPPHAQPVTGPTLAEPGLRAAPATELLNQVQGGLARVQLSQLASLPNSDSSPPAWVLELPVRHAGESHVIQMHIEADAQSSRPEPAGQERKDWTVTLALDLKGLGPLHIKVSVRDEKVSASFWADQGATVELLNQHIGQLRAQMSNAGLEVTSIHCAAGCRPPVRNSQMSAPLLDIKI